MITGFVADDGKSFETVLKLDKFKYDELSNEERYELLQQKELIDELLDEGTQSVEDEGHKRNVQRHFYKEESRLYFDEGES